MTAYPTTSAPSIPRASRSTLVLFALALLVAAVNGLAALAYTPSAHLQSVGDDVSDSRMAPAILGQPWDLLATIGLIVLAWGLLRRRRAAWAGAVTLFAVLSATDLLRHEPVLEVAVPVVGFLALLMMRRVLVAEPYREILRRNMIPSSDALARTARLVRAYGTDTLAPFKLRADVGHLFSTRGDAVLAFRVENRAMIVSGEPVGTKAGTDDVLRIARDLARHAGLRFGVTSASEEFAARLRDDFGMHSMYMGCEAIVEVDRFTLDGHRIKKVRQAHRRVQREGLTLRHARLADLTPTLRAEMRRCGTASRGEDVEQSFSMAPDSLDGVGLADALVFYAINESTGKVGGLMVLNPLQQRSLWSLALQLRDPDSPNGVIDALIVHALQTAKELGVAELSLNFAAARRYVHLPVHGFWPHLGRFFGKLAMRWTQIDDLRYHNEKFSPRWEQRFVVADHKLQFPHIAFGVIWQEGQLPRPDAFIAPAWPQCQSELAEAA